MDFNIQLDGLNNLLKVMYGEESDIIFLLREAGFDEMQVKALQGQLEAIVPSFLEIIHERLTSDSGKDTYYRILARRYGLDGMPAEQLSSIAPQYDYSPEYLKKLFEEILQRCKSKTWQSELRKALKQIAAQKLSQLNQKPTREHIAEKLQRLENLRSAADAARMDYEAKRAEIMQKVQAELDALASEYQPILDSAEENISTLENEIKTDVLLHGESVASGRYRATFTRGRTSWDTKGMEQYAAAHPEVLKFRKQGQPIVTLRVVDKE